MQSPRAETHHVRTRDGWKIALHNYARNSRKFPVFLCHGLGSNRHDLDYGREKSLAKFLHRNGYDVWVVELRGAGESSKPRPWNRRRYNWCFDDYVTHDLPAALRYVTGRTGADGVHWVGHSMGGMLAYPMMQVVDEGLIQTATTIGSPLMTDEKNAELGGVADPNVLMRFLPFIPQGSLLRLAMPLAPLLLEKIVSGGDKVLWNGENMDRKDLLRLGRCAVDDLPVSLIRQMQEWYLTSSFRSYYGSWNYVEHLKRVKTPLHVITGSADGLCPPEDCRVAYDLIGTREKRFSTFGTAFGHKIDYGHIDLVLGIHAPKEVYPEVLGWIEEFNGI